MSDWTHDLIVVVPAGLMQEPVKRMRKELQRLFHAQGLKGQT